MPLRLPSWALEGAPRQSLAIAHAAGADEGLRCGCPVCAGAVTVAEPNSPAGGQAYLNADARDGAVVGGKISYSIDRAAKQLTGFDPVTGEPYPGWSSAVGVGFTVTYAFRASEPVRMPSDVTGFLRFNAAQIIQAELALQAWADVANIRFVRVGSGTSGEGAYSNNATILFANYSSGEDGASAFAMFPGNTSPSSSSGDVWINIKAGSNASPAIGNYGGQVLIHEIGHAIGLTHPGDYNAGPGTVFTYAQHAEYYQDSRQYTVMSYFAETNTGANFRGRYAAVPLLDDIAAAQLEYGINWSTRTGDTVYGFNSTAERPWFEATSSSSALVFAVWDAGGTDTLDFSGYLNDQLIELREGFFSDVGGLVGNVAIAKGAQIENARGGAGHDRIHGNALANELVGNGGHDTLTGAQGDDVLVGGAGDDLIRGEAGVDAARYGGHSSQYAWSETAEGWSVRDLRAGAPDGTDLVQGVERLIFADRSVWIGASSAAPDPALAAAVRNILRVDPATGPGSAVALDLTSRVAEGSVTYAGAIAELVRSADATTSIANLTYAFFTGATPWSGGLDYLVSPDGGNAYSLNSVHYQSFSLENRYINFAVNLGKAGEGAAGFAAKYGHLDLVQAGKLAYAEIFGSTPADAWIQALIAPRADYFAYYGGDGQDGLGTKAAMVGWLLAEAEKADVGIYARANAAFLADLADGAELPVSLVAAYGQPDFVHSP